MKKFLTIMLVAITAVMLSSCIIITSDTPHTNYYNLTCHNESNTRITDWCVVKDGEATFAKSKTECCPIAGNGGTSTMTLPEGKYIVYVAFVSEPDHNYGDYIRTREFTLNRDMDVYIDQTYVPSNY